MKTVEFSTKINLSNEYDVIVIGGGPAGCAAAASAAREGSKTLLIEATGFLGGMGTGGLVPSWCPFSDKDKIIYRGMAEKILNKTKDLSPHIMPQDLEWVPIDAEILKRVYDEFLTDYGVDILFNTYLAGTHTNKEGEVTEIYTVNKKGLSGFSAKTFIDCTGDADLVAMAGGAYSEGDSSGTLMPATLCFVITNIDEYAYRFDSENGLNFGSMRGTNPKSVIHKIVKDNKYPLVTDSHFCYQLIGPRTVGLNAGHLFNVDNTDPVSVSKALIKGRELAHQIHEGLKEYFPSAFGSSMLVATAPLMGVREGRRIIGDYTLTINDYLTKRTFEDEISRNSYYIDIHPTQKQASDPNFNIELFTHRYGKGESHGIPYRCLLPKNLSNVIVAGRSVSCDREIQGSVRVMPNCLCTGEAAGMAAAMASSRDGNVHKIDVKLLRSRLKDEGAYFL